MIDFDALTAKQLDVLGQISIGNDGFHPKKTITSLMQKSLIERHDVDAGGGLTIWHYEMPLAVHMEWCEWCSRGYEE